MRVKTYCIGIFLFLVLQSLCYAEKLQLVTEDYPPFNMRESGEHTGNPDDPLIGISTDIVKELFKRAGIDFTLKIYAWTRAYNMALNEAGVGVFSTFRTPEREPLFKWVGPLVTNNWILMAKKSRNIRINSVEDACKYKIGGYTGDAIAAFLEEKGCKVEYTIYDHLNVRKLDAERIDLWATGNMLGPYFAKKEGITGLEQAFLIKETSMSLAFNKSVPDDTIDKLNKILQEMENDGTTEKIFSHYR